MKKGDLVRVKASEFDDWGKHAQGFRATTEEEREQWRQQLRSDIDAGLTESMTLQESLSLLRGLTGLILRWATHTWCSEQEHTLVWAGAMAFLSVSTLPARKPVSSSTCTAKRLRL